MARRNLHLWNGNKFWKPGVRGRYSVQASRPATLNPLQHVSCLCGTLSALIMIEKGSEKPPATEMSDILLHTPRLTRQTAAASNRNNIFGRAPKPCSLKHEQTAHLLMMFGASSARMTEARRISTFVHVCTCVCAFIAVYQYAHTRHGAAPDHRRQPAATGDPTQMDRGKLGGRVRRHRCAKISAVGFFCCLPRHVAE